MSTMMMGVVITALIVLFVLTLRFTYVRGYKTGAKMVLGEWKKWMNLVEGENNERK